MPRPFPRWDFHGGGSEVPGEMRGSSSGRRALGAEAGRGGPVGEEGSARGRAALAVPWWAQTMSVKREEGTLTRAKVGVCERAEK